MRASTAFMVGVGTVGLAIAGGLGGGLMIANMMSPAPASHASKHSSETVGLARSSPAPSPSPSAALQPMPAAAALPYAASTLAFTDPAIDGSTPAGSGEQPAQMKHASTAEDAGAKADAKVDSKADSKPDSKTHEADLKHAADKRHAERAQRFSERRLPDGQRPDQQARGGRGEDVSAYADERPDPRYRDDRMVRYRDADRSDDDRASRYDDGPPPRAYVDDAPRFGFPGVQLFGPDD